MGVTWWYIFSMDDFVALVGHLAWPTVALLVLYTVRREIRKVVSNIAERIGDPRSAVSIGKDGVAIKPLEVTQSASPADDATAKLTAALKSDPDFEKRLRRWMRGNGLDISLTLFLYGDLYEPLRKAAADRLLDGQDTTH